MFRLSDNQFDYFSSFISFLVLSQTFFELLSLQVDQVVSNVQDIIIIEIPHMSFIREHKCVTHFGHHMGFTLAAPYYKVHVMSDRAHV